MDGIFLIIIGAFAVLALLVWVLSKITIPLLKAGVSLFFVIMLVGVITLIVLAFMYLGLYAFLVIGLLAVGLILKILNIG